MVSTLGVGTSRTARVVYSQGTANELSAGEADSRTRILRRRCWTHSIVRTFSARPSTSAADASLARQDGVSERLRRDAELNRQRVVRAARELTAERGLAVTLHDVARHAGVGVGTAYRRYPDLQSLIADVITESARELADLTADGLHTADPWTRLADWFMHVVLLLVHDRGHIDVWPSLCGWGSIGVVCVDGHLQALCR